MANLDYVAISSARLQELFDKGGSDCVALWMKYAYHCKRQKANQVKATQSFMQKGLNWGRDKTHKVKQKLEELGFIEQIAKRGSQGKVVEWYIKVNHLPKEATLLKTSIVVHPTENTTCGETSIQMLKGNKNKCLKDNNLEEEENKKANSQGGEVSNQPTSPILTATVPRNTARPVSTVTVSDVDVKVDAIISFAKDFWANESYTAEGEEEPITPVTRANIIKRLKEGFTVAQFKKAIEDSTFWSAGVPRTLGNMTKTKGKFNSYVTWQSRIEDEYEAWEMKNKNGKYAYKLRKQE